MIPKFSFVPSGVDWFVKRGQFRPDSYIPKPGDIIFIDWGGDGTRDHVGIVERCVVKQSTPSRVILVMLAGDRRIASEARPYLGMACRNFLKTRTKQQGRQR